MDQVDMFEHIEKGEATQQQVHFDDVMLDTQVLAELLLQETAHMRAMNIDGVKELYDEKVRLIKRLEIQKELLKRQPEILQGFDESQKESLKEYTDIFEKILRENYEEAVKAKEINRRIVDCISDAVSNHINSSNGYNKEGRNYNLKEKDGSLPALTLNEEI